MKSLVNLIFLALTLAAHGTASADISISVTLIEGPSGSAIQQVTEQQPISHNFSLEKNGAFGSAAGNLQTGILRTASVTNVVPSLGFASFAAASVTLRDIVTFAAGASGTAYLDWGFDGSIDVEPNKPAPGSPAQAGLSFLITPSDGGEQVNVSAAFATSGADCPGTAPPHCVTGPFSSANVALRGTLPFDIRPGAFTFAVGLSSNARWGDEVHFENTSYLYLRLPDGVNYTSASGVFLTNALPVPLPVPEPATAMLMACGGLAIYARRRWAVRSAQATWRQIQIA